MTEPRAYGYVRGQVRAAEHSSGAEAADTGSMCLVRDVRVRPNTVHPVHDIRNFVDPLQHPGNAVPHMDLVRPRHQQ